MENSFETVYCIHCKAPIAENVVTCPKCGGSQLPGSAPPSAGAPTTTARPLRRVRWEKGRPTGVTVIAVIMLLNGIFGLMGACAMTSLIEITGGETAEAQAARSFFAYIVPLIALFDLVLGVGLLYMKPWARIVAIVVSLIGVGIGLLGMALEGIGGGSIISLAINGFVAFYLIILGPEFSDYYED